MKRTRLGLAIALVSSSLSMPALAHSDASYSGFPITVKDYKGDKKSSVAYSGQIARHALHDSLKKLSARGNGMPNAELKAQMMAYYAGKDAGRKIIAPATKGDFVVKQGAVDELSKGKNLKGKTYGGAVSAWPGNMTGSEVIEFWIDKASAANKGFDPLTGLDYTQLISKFLMGAVFYNQAVDNYLDEKLDAGTKPNGKPYKDGTPYTGKEHVWDEAFGYFGVPAHALSLDAKTAYSIAKQKPESVKSADANGDKMIDLKSEMVFAHGYYAAGADKSGNSNYMHTITEAFIDGRQLITKANGKNLTDQQREELKAYADVIRTNWEKVIAEAAFKYAGSVYKDALALQDAVDNNGDLQKTFRTYAKHWGELKGFAMALQVSGKDLGVTAVKLNRLIGASPVLLGNTQVSGIDNDGNYIQSPSVSLEEYALNMIEVQKLLNDTFGLQAKANDQLDKLSKLAEKLSNTSSAEND